MTPDYVARPANPQPHPHLDDDHDEDVINPVKEIDGEKFWWLCVTSAVLSPWQRMTYLSWVGTKRAGEQIEGRIDRRNWGAPPWVCLSLPPNHFGFPQNHFRFPKKSLPSYSLNTTSQRINPDGATHLGVKAALKWVGECLEITSNGLKITLRSLLQWISAAWVFSIWDQGLLAIHEITAEQIQLAIQAPAVVRQSINCDSNARAGPGPLILRCVRLSETPCWLSESQVFQIICLNSSSSN